jgi:hypothetical protein
MSRHSCRYCGKPFPTTAGEKRHVQQTRSCLAQWREELNKFSVNVFDLQNDDPPEHESTISDLECDAPDDPDRFQHALGDGTDFEQSDYDEPQPRGVYVEEVVDEDEPTREVDEDEPIRESDKVQFVEEFPAEGYAGAVYEKMTTTFEEIKQAEAAMGGHKWGPFVDEEEWELAEWLLKNVGQKQTDAFLKLPIVRCCLTRFELSPNNKRRTNENKPHTQTIARFYRLLTVFLQRVRLGSVM